MRCMYCSSVSIISTMHYHRYMPYVVMAIWFMIFHTVSIGALFAFVYLTIFRNNIFTSVPILQFFDLFVYSGIFFFLLYRSCSAVYSYRSFVLSNRAYICAFQTDHLVLGANRWCYLVQSFEPDTYANTFFL